MNEIPEWIVTRPSDSATAGGPRVHSRVEVIAPLLEWNRREPVLHGAAIRTDVQMSFRRAVPDWYMRIHWDDAPVRMVVSWDRQSFASERGDSDVVEMHCDRAYIRVFELDEEQMYRRGRRDWSECSVRDFDRLTAMIAAAISGGYDYDELWAQFDALAPCDGDVSWGGPAMSEGACSPWKEHKSA